MRASPHWSGKNKGDENIHTKKIIIIACLLCLFVFAAGCTGDNEPEEQAAGDVLGTVETYDLDNETKTLTVELYKESAASTSSLKKIIFMDACQALKGADEQGAENVTIVYRAGDKKTIMLTATYGPEYQAVDWGAVLSDNREKSLKDNAVMFVLHPSLN